MIVRNESTGKFWMGWGKYSEEYPDARQVKTTMQGISILDKLRDQTDESHALIKDYGLETEAVVYQATRID